MFYRLHTPTPEHAALKLRAGKGKAVAEVPEFFVAGEAGVAAAKAAAKGASSSSNAPPKAPPTESSSLLCLERPGKGPS